MAAAPENADERGLHNGALAADDGGDRDHVIGIGCVAHAKQEPDSQNGEAAGHDLKLYVMAALILPASDSALDARPYLSIA